MAELKHKRILLKIGGEALAGPQGNGIDPVRAAEVAGKVREVKELGVQIALVLGAGNIWRGKDGMALGMERATADHMGMLATVMNALALQDALERAGVTTRVQTSIEMRSLAEPYIRLRAIRHLEKDRVVIIGAGTGNPYFTTDTAAALRAMEIGADALIKATKVNAVYEVDPNVNSHARRFEFLTYDDALSLRVGVMDITALTLCMENGMPIYVVGLWQPHVLPAVVMGQRVGTLVARSDRSSELGFPPPPSAERE